MKAWTLLLLGWWSGIAWAHAAAPSTAATDLDRAIAQFREFQLGARSGAAPSGTNEPAADPQRARRFAEALREDGSWGDIAYDSRAHSGWPPAMHASRLTAMAAEAAGPGVDSDDRAELLAAVHRAFGFWIRHDFQCPNWWYNEIGIPKELGALGLVLGEELLPAERRYLIDVVLARSPIGRTGQNRIWLAGNTLMRGLLGGDDARVRRAADAIWGELRVSTDEGLQPDFSFHQHGAQQQFGNYGMAFAVELARWGQILRGTLWALDADRLALFRRYLLDGQAWVSWRGAMDISACGRQLMPHSPRSKTATIAAVMRQAARFDPGHAAEYETFVSRNRPGTANDLVGDRYFWRSDYLVHRSAERAMTLKLSSNRVIGAELVNSENLSGYHTADGALYLYRDGGEYDDIFPVWDWRRLPGVTCAQTEVPAYKTSFVPRDFVGGVSDGATGCAALDYARDGVRAKKAWFFDGEIVVCLGADIAGQVPAGIATTLNQCLRRGPVRLVTPTGPRELGRGQHQLGDAAVVEHDGWRYRVLEGRGLRLEIGPVTGNWRRVFSNPETPTADVTKDLFTLWLDHGAKPKDARYAYVIGSTAANAAEPEVLENSGARQAVRFPDGKVAAVFWSAGEMTLPGGRRIGVGQPCAMILGPDSLRIVDPTQKRSALTLVVDGATRTIELPRGGLAGTPAVVPLAR